MTSKSYSGLDATPSVTYCYDGSFFQATNGCVQGTAANAVGRLTSVSNLVTANSNPVGTTSNYLSFDSEGRVLSSGQQTDSTVWPKFQYQYTPGGRLKKIQYPSGRLVSYGFDTMGRANAVAKGGNVPAAGAASAANSYLWDTTYLANGQVQGFRYGTRNPRYSNRLYNFRNQPTMMQVGSSAINGDVWQLENDYGSDNANSGNVLWQYLTPSTGSLISTGYHYDGFDRLDLAAEKPGTAKNGFTPVCPDAGAAWCFQYGYDVYGNRSIAQRAGSGSGVALNEPGAYTAASNRIAGGTWAYDERGNIKEDGSGAGMAWDAENRMIDYCAGVSAGCGDTTAGAVRYAYDGEGHRTKTAIGGTSTMYVYDAFENLAAEYGGQAGAGLQFPVQDHLGTTRAMMDASGAVVERVDYHPFGTEIPAEAGSWRTQIAGYGLSAPTTRLRFTGKERDSETGLDFFESRYYSSAQGRFTSPDEFKGGFLDAFSGQPAFQPGPLPYADLGDPQTLNKYAYVRNNPLRYTDPNGHCIFAIVDTIACGEAVLVAGTAAVSGAAYLMTPQGKEATRAFIVGTGTLINKAIDGIQSLAGTPSKAPQGISDPVHSDDLLGSKGTQLPGSVSVGKGLGEKGDIRVDVENPDPGGRAGQIQVQGGAGKGKETQLYDPRADTFSPGKGNNPTSGNRISGRELDGLRENRDFQRALDKAKKILGEQ
jgi:RHS repeat-associated protein